MCVCEAYCRKCYTIFMVSLNVKLQVKLFRKVNLLSSLLSL